MTYKFRSIAFRSKSMNSDNSRTGVCSMINWMKNNVNYFDSQHLWTKHIFDRSWDRQTETHRQWQWCVIPDYWSYRKIATESGHDTSILDSCLSRVVISRWLHSSVDWQRIKTWRTRSLILIWFLIEPGQKRTEWFLSIGVKLKLNSFIG